MKKTFSLILTGCMLLTLASCSKAKPQQETTSDQTTQTEAVTETATQPQETEDQETQQEGIDYLVLVNKLNKLPDGWEETLETVTVTNSVGDTVEVEKKTYDAYLLLKDDLEKNDGIYLELDSGRRTVAEQQDIMDRFIEKYGADYAAKTVAQPGYSEHHTGLAIDLYFRLKGDDGSFTDVYYNEDMVQYPEIWNKIHSKLADYGFILRYISGSEHITGYGYEPWHLRYVDSTEIANVIMSGNLTLEEYLGVVEPGRVLLIMEISSLYSMEEMMDAVVQIKCLFASWEGCELREIRYAGDDACNEENLEWLNSLGDGYDYKELMKFVIDFHSPEDGGDIWMADYDYTDYEFWLGRNEKGGWDIVSYGMG